MFPNTTVNTTVVNSGCSTIHSGPRIVWRYMIVKLRLTISQTRSRYCQSALKSIANQPRLGRMIVVHCPLACFLAMKCLLGLLKIYSYISYHVCPVGCKRENVNNLNDKYLF